MAVDTLEKYILFDIFEVKTTVNKYQIWNLLNRKAQWKMWI